VDEPTFRSPVPTGHHQNPSGSITITDLSDQTKRSLKAPETSSVASVLGVALGTAARINDTLVVHHRPGEWLLVGHSGSVGQVLDSIDRSGFVSTVDVSHGRLLLLLSGRESDKVLAKLCSTNLDDDFTPNGAAWGASVARVNCDLVRDDVQGVRSYLLLCDSSYGSYLHGAIAEAAEEFAH